MRSWFDRTMRVSVRSLASMWSPRALGPRMLFLGAVVLGLVACNRYPKTPEEALAQIERVVVAGDALSAWEIVDTETRSAAESVWSDERLMQTIVKAKFPPAEAARELERLKGADEPDARRFFAATAQRWRQIEGYRKRLGSVSGPIKTKPDRTNTDSLWVSRADGMAFQIVKAGSGWAWMDLRGEWLLERGRAGHAVKTVRDNAALYKRNDTP